MTKHFNKDFKNLTRYKASNKQFGSSIFEVQTFQSAHAFQLLKRVAVSRPCPNHLLVLCVALLLYATITLWCCEWQL